MKPSWLVTCRGGGVLTRSGHWGICVRRRGLGIELTEGQPDTSANKRNEKKSRTMKKLIAVAGLGAAITVGSLVGAGTASATTNDAVFLQVLAERGIYGVGGPDYGLIQTGHAVCIDLQNGVPFNSEVWALQQFSQMGGGVLDPGAAGYFIGASQAAYCPWTDTPAPQPQLDYAV